MMDETSRLNPGLPRPPPAHAKYDFATGKPRPRKGNCIKCFCIAFVIALLLALGINAIVMLIAFKKAEAPEFQVKTVKVARFSTISPLNNDRAVLSADLTFDFECNNKNPIVGVDLGDMEMQATWGEMNAQLGESRLEDFAQRARGKKEIKVSTKNEVEISKKDVKPEDMKLELSLFGELKYFAGPFKTKKYPFMVSCGSVSPTSINVGCSTKLYSSGEAPSKSRQKPTPAPTASPPPPSGESPAQSPSRESFPPVKLTVQDKYVILDNGLLAVTIAKPAGFVTGIKYNGIDNILDTVNPEDDRGYWDVVWALPGTKGTKGTFVRIIGKDFRVIIDKEDRIELSFKFGGYDPSKATKKDVPLEIDQRYIMLRGESGIYSYGIFERKNWAAFGMPNARLAFKLQRQQFKYMVIADNRQREMPVPEDRLKPRGQELEYPEAVLLVDPIDPQFKGEVDDKYQYSMESQDIRVHGFISKNPPTGFWQITPSYEFRSGGPNKQFLTSHVGPSVLAMFVSAHYSGEELVPKFEEGEPWTHVYGPIFMYMNNVSKGEDFKLLWDDAKKKMEAEVKGWPYDFVASEAFPKANERVNVSGRFFVHDKLVEKEKAPAKGAYIGFGPPGEAGSWQRDCKTYQFWTRTDEEGYFNITHVRVGNYNLFGWVRGYIGDYKYDKPINITVGENIDLGELVFEPPRDGPTMWEIGVPDRLAREFFIPDPNPKYINKLYVNHPDKFRQYGLWERYTELYPDEDLIYTVNSSDYKKDWFFAQVTKKIGARYNGTTWQVKFSLDNVEENGVYKLRIAIASATNSDLEVRFNEPKPAPALFTSGRIGNDNSIARHGIHGLYWLYNIDVKGNLLKKGNNTLFLTQTKGVSPFQGIMYDYIRLEGPQKK